MITRKVLDAGAQERSPRPVSTHSKENPKARAQIILREGSGKTHLLYMEGGISYAKNMPGHNGVQNKLNTHYEQKLCQPVDAENIPWMGGVLEYWNIVSCSIHYSITPGLSVRYFDLFAGHEGVSRIFIIDFGQV